MALSRVEQSFVERTKQRWAPQVPWIWERREFARGVGRQFSGVRDNRALTRVWSLLSDFCLEVSQRQAVSWKRPPVIGALISLVKCL